MSSELYITQQIINAISLGSLYALVAIGLSMIFGILRMTNFAHGDMMMVGAFGTLVLGSLNLGFGWAVVGGIGIGALAGVIVERVAYRPVRGAPSRCRLTVITRPATCATAAKENTRKDAPVIVRPRWWLYLRCWSTYQRLHRGVRWRLRI